MSNVISLAEGRAARAQRNAPTWQHDILTCCAYAKLVRADHDAESARIHFDARIRGLICWSEAEDLKERTDANHLEWARYIGLLRHMAALPADTRAQAKVKRNTIGKMWLAPDVSCPNLFGAMREGCLQDDHLFPRSMKLARA